MDAIKFPNQLPFAGVDGAGSFPVVVGFVGAGTGAGVWVSSTGCDGAGGVAVVVVGFVGAGMGGVSPGEEGVSSPSSQPSSPESSSPSSAECVQVGCDGTGGVPVVGFVGAGTDTGGGGFGVVGAGGGGGGGGTLLAIKAPLLTMPGKRVRYPLVCWLKNLLEPSIPQI